MRKVLYGLLAVLTCVPSPSAAHSYIGRFVLECQLGKPTARNWIHPSWRDDYVEPDAEETKITFEINADEETVRKKKQYFEHRLLLGNHAIEIRERNIGDEFVGLTSTYIYFAHSTASDGGMVWIQSYAGVGLDESTYWVSTGTCKKKAVSA